MNKFQRSLSGIASSVVLLGAVVAAPANAQDIKIALAGPVTGPVAQYGDMQMIGAKMAIEQINAKGGIKVGGKMHKLKAEVFDDACDPKQAVAVANKIVNEGIHYVVGHLCSGSTQPASDIYEDEGIVMVTAASTSPKITQRGFKMIFRTIGLDSMQGPIAGDYIANVIKPKRMAIIHDKQQYGEGIATAVKKTVEAKGVNVVLFDGNTSGDKDFSALIAKLKKDKVDFVYYGGYHPELGLILRQASEKGLHVQFMGPEGVGNKELSTIAGKASEGLLVTLPPSFDKLPKNKALVKDFLAKKEDPTGAFVMTAYAAAEVIADGIQGVGKDDPIKVAKYIHTHSFKTPIGKIAFDKKGDLKNARFVIYHWHSDGTKTKIK